MTAPLFLADVERTPETLLELADRVRAADPWEFLRDAPARVVLVGMGSSAYAAGVAAARLRASGVLAVSELAGSDLLPRWGNGTAVVAVSAGGGSRETLDAVERLRPEATTVALTNDGRSALAARCDHTVELHAGPELGGVACRTFRHTLALLLTLEARLTGTVPRSALADLFEKAAEAAAGLLDNRASWLSPVAELLDGPAGTHLVAPARRLSSARQGALMLREGPRRASVACESGDWAHVDVYLTKNTDYRLLVFSGSAWDATITEWTGPRHTTVVTVGGDFPGSALTVRYPHDGIDDVRLLTETLVPELVAAHLWAAADA